jgi:hypothetical protein
VKGVPGSAELRRKLHAVVSLSQVEDVFAEYLANPNRYDFGSPLVGEEELVETSEAA